MANAAKVPINRDLLFGDLPLHMWPPAGSSHVQTEPWSSFIAARCLVAEGRVTDAIALWSSITQKPNLESRHYAQAWHFLRAHGGEVLAERRSELLAVVLEIPIDHGLDVLAAYRDMNVRYINHSGAAIIWDHPDASLDSFTGALLSAGEQVHRRIGVWKGTRPNPPPSGQLRFNFLSSAGLSFGQGSFEAINKDPLAKPVIAAGTDLMRQLIARCRPTGT